MVAALDPDKLLAALRAEGLRVVEYRSWRTHRRPASTGGFGPINGVMLHHTVTLGNTAAQTAASVELCYNGHSNLPGPLCHGVIAKDGTVYLISNGRANHAGKGDDDVLRMVQEESYPRDALLVPNEANTDGNTCFYGFECINLGDGKDPWPAVQLAAIEKAAAAICRAHGWSERSVIGHLEWQPGKVDPRGFGMGWIRGLIKDRLAGTTTTTPAPAPSEEDDMTPEQARQLKELHDLLTPYAGWDYRGKLGDKPDPRDAFNYLRTTDRNVASLGPQIAALTAVNKQLVDTVARLAADVGDLDPAAIVAELTSAIESVQVRLDVPDVTPTS